ncbi:uncharacterized protein CTRU02_206419 [Colletotrichum truncatum]|uniref:Uncharacterized protein n=1 Tax=Colletotrichum truncatum TaxID=5467 RepID=A0ACC3Z6V0_COLTU|nr:uncharacterized protein CTRU02_09743 [Colletotrichum truncatum]KAF6787930.1 hypothetical protein CTRU02_09743 [Colletotrichum truncatum]
MRFFLLSIILAAAPFAAAGPEPIQPFQGEASPHQLHVRNVLLDTRGSLASCCSTKFVPPCDCNNCPVGQCTSGGKGCAC